eukprot:7277642-Prymnesium_polylepis.1
MKRYDTPIRTKKKVYLVHTWPAILTDGDTARLHSTHAWSGKWAGPEGASYASDVMWDYYGIEKRSELTDPEHIQILVTRIRGAQRLFTA